MSAQEFCYWLQGFFEIAGVTELTEDQAKIVNEHLQLVFTKVTSKMGEAPDLTKVEWPTDPIPWPTKIEGHPFDHLSRPTIYC